MFGTYLGEPMMFLHPVADCAELSNKDRLAIKCPTTGVGQLKRLKGDGVVHVGLFVICVFDKNYARALRYIAKQLEQPQ